MTIAAAVALMLAAEAPTLGTDGPLEHDLRDGGLEFAAQGPAKVVLKIQADSSGEAVLTLVRNEADTATSIAQFKRKAGGKFIKQFGLEVPEGKHLYQISSNDAVRVTAKVTKRLGKRVQVIDDWQTPAQPAVAAPAIAETPQEAEALRQAVDAPTPAPEDETQPTAGDEDKFSIAIMDLKVGNGVEPDLVSALTTTMTQDIEALGVFKAVSTAEIRQMIDAESMKQQAGCDTMSCLAEIAGAIGAQYTVFGSVIKLGGVFLVQVQLINSAEARAVNRVQKEYDGSPVGLLKESRAIVKMLLQGLLDLKAGTLDVAVSEAGATVKVDGVIIGLTPLEPFTVAGGIHTLGIEKIGFVRYTRDLEVVGQKVTRHTVRLQPSEAYKRAYLENAERTRRLAWTGIGVGGGALASALGMWMYRRGATDDLNADIYAYENEPGQQNAENQRDLSNRADRLALINSLTWVAGLVGVASVTGGWLAYRYGDDPDHFNTETEVDPKTPTPVAVTLTPTGFALSGTF